MRRKRLGIISLISLVAARRARGRTLGQHRQREHASKATKGHKIFFLPEADRRQRLHRERQGREGGRRRSSATRVTYNGPTEAVAAKQVPFIDAAARQGYDAIIISANDPNAVAPALKRAQQRGLKVISYDGDVAQGRPHDLRQPADGVGDRRVPGRVDRRPDRLQGRDRDPLGHADRRQPEHVDQVHEGRR